MPQSLGANSPADQMDLSITQITTPSPRRLIATTQMTAFRAMLAAIFALVSLGLTIFVWLHRDNLWELIFPHCILIPVFGAIAIVVGFGWQQKIFDAAHHTLEDRTKLGPFSRQQRYTLPLNTTVKITFRKQYAGNPNSTGAGTSTRYYDINVMEVPAAGFTIAEDRDAARAFAQTLATTLNSTVIDEVEDDGVTRIPARAGKPKQ